MREYMLQILTNFSFLIVYPIQRTLWFLIKTKSDFHIPSPKCLWFTYWKISNMADFL